MKILRTLALVGFVAATTPVQGWAQGGPPPGPPSQERPMKRELPPEAKTLLERQREEMRALRQKHQDERRALRQKLLQERKDRGFPGGPPEKKPS
jgi:Spy/CpxP family protein refolding chaperone